MAHGAHPAHAELAQGAPSVQTQLAQGAPHAHAYVPATATAPAQGVVISSLHYNLFVIDNSFFLNTTLFLCIVL